MPAQKDSLLAIAADGIGAVSITLGCLLTAAPLAGGRWLGLTDTGVERQRLLGISDLVLGITIMSGRSSGWRWRAVAARALLHLLFAHEYRRTSRRQGAVAMIALFAFDAGIALGLRKAAHSTEQVPDATSPKHETPS